MRLHRKTFVLFLLMLMVSIQNAWAEPSEPFRAKLDNGLTVLIEEEHAAPVVSIQMWVRVGSADEPERLSGISHVFEHMLFKGTEKRKVGQIANMIESVGGDINAYTSFDNTVYHLSVPSRHFSTGLDVISDAIQNSSFDPEELKKELEVVLEEIRMNEDSPGRNLYKSLLATAYTTHTYKRPVIGTRESVKSFTRNDIVGFFKKWYIPNNMTLVITGDVDRAVALKAVKDAFKGFAKKEDPHRKRPSEPEQKTLRTNIITKPIAEAHFGMAYHIPAVKNEETYTIDVIANILAGGEASRLYKKIKLEEELVHSISAYPMSLKDPGLFFITATLEPDNIDKTFSEAVYEVERLAFEGPDHEELQRAKVNIESEFVYSRETMEGIASKLGYYQTNLGDYQYEKEYIEGIRKVTPEDIKKILKKYFKAENTSVSVLLPDKAKDALSKDAIGGTITAAYQKAKTDFVKEEDKAERIEKVRLENGITLVIKEVRANPTVAFYATFPGGLRYEDGKTNGIGNFTANMLTRGTKKRTREELAKEVEEIAGGVGGFSGWNSTGASGKFMSMFFDKGLEMLSDIIKNPTFPEDEIEKLKTDTLAAIKRQEDNPPAYTFKLLYKELYKEHPYGMPVIGTPETVSNFKQSDLMAHYERFFTPERMVLVIVGDIDRDYAVERVRTLFKDFNRPSAPLPAPPIEERQTKVREVSETMEKAQVNIGIGFLGTTIGSEDSYPLHVLTEVLSGQGGRLFLKLRDMQSLAYSVSAFSRVGRDPGILGAYIASAPEKKNEAVNGILNELREITTNRVADEEIKRAKNSIIGGYEIGLQEISSQAADMANNELYGLGYGFSKIFPEKIEAVTADDILRVGRKYLTLDAYTISIVGPDGTEPKEKKISH